VLFVVYCIAIYCALKLALKNDLVFGCISLMRRKGCSVTTTTVLLFIHLFITVFGPLAIGILWWFKVSQNEEVEDWIVGFSVFWTVAFITCTIQGFSNWYGSMWNIECFSQAMFTLAAFSVAAFSVIVCVNLDPFTYTGTSAIFFALNFAPACFLIYMKKQWNDTNIKLLYHKVA
jgi:hypothetical protein